jgi:gliding motility-associated-like protein
MIAQLKQIIIGVWIFFLSGQAVYSQPYASWNNYTGAWETPASWNPTWAVPQTNISGYDITINGYITLNGSLTFSTSASNLIINDTLVIKGNLSLGNNNDVVVNDDGILIIRGNLTINNQTNIQSDGYFIVTGDIIKNGSVYQGSFSSNDNPVKVFIGGSVSSADITNKPDYPVLNCTAPTTTIYPNSACSYGNHTDIINDPIYSFFQSTCTISTISNNGPICAGNSIYLSSAGGTGYAWTGPNGFASNAQNPSIPNASAAMSGTYTITITAAAGCTVKDSTHVTINALPLVDAGTDATIPNGTSTTINAAVTGTGPFTYSWTPFTKLVNALIEDPSTVNLAATTVYTLTATSTTTSCSNTDAVTITVSGGALGSTPAATPGTVCPGGNVQLNAIASGGSGSYTYTWTSTPVGFTSSVDEPTVNPAVNTTYNVAVFDGVNTVNSQVTVTVNPVPATPTITAGGPTTFCAGGSVTLTSSAGTSYLWSNTETAEIINVTTAGSYAVKVTNASGCQSAVSAATTVVVNALPEVNITSSSSSLCIHDSRILTGDPSGGIFTVVDGPGTITGNVLSATGTGNINLVYDYTNICANKAAQSIIVNEIPVAYAGPDQELKFVYETQMNAELLSYETGEWSLISGTGIIGDIQDPAATVAELSVGENKFLWTVVNGYCEASDEVIIKVSELFVPSVITPNGDGKNDYFKISETTGQVELIIFNRWGNEEYANVNYSNDWDGSNNEGVKLPNDTYFYILKFENGQIQKGSVLILR